MPISIFDYRISKIPLIIQLYDDCQLYKENCYIDADWERGPNVMLVFDNVESEQRLLNKIKKATEYYVRMNPISENEMAKQTVLYSKNQNVLRQVENRVPSKEKLLNDGYVMMRKSKSHVFNSVKHEQEFFNCRCELNSVYIKILRKFMNLTEQERCNMFLYQYIEISKLFEDGGAYGYLSFLSHVQGFFSRINDRNARNKILEKFEQFSKTVYTDSIIIPKGLEEELNEWKNKWVELNKKFHDNFSYSNYEDSNYLDLETQFKAFIKTVSPLDNNFHSEVLKIDNVKDFILSKKMLVYRDIINLFYLSLPVFEQSMFKKQFYAYATVKYYENILQEKVEFKFQG